MSVEALAVVLNHSKAKGTAKLVLLGIANHDGDGGAWVGIGRLAVYANVDERNVQRAIAKLVSSGELAPVHYNGGGTHHTPDDRRPNLYSLRLECPPWCDRTTQHRDTRKLAGRQLGLPVDNPSRRGGASATPMPNGVAPAPPRGVAPAPPEPYIEPQPQQRGASTTDRARLTPCADCGQTEARCQLAQAKWQLEDRHPYTAAGVAHAEG